MRKNESLRDGVYMFNGYMTNELLSTKFDFQYKDLNLIMSAI